VVAAETLRTLLAARTHETSDVCARAAGSTVGGHRRGTAWIGRMVAAVASDAHLVDCESLDVLLLCDDDLTQR
jgi:hypothetical protein